MRASRRLAILLAALATAGPASAAMTLGVNTHFEQGWPIAALDKVRESGAHNIRESINWGKVERTAGHYDFTPANSGFLDRICAQRLSVLLVVPMRNALYDGGGPPVSTQARQAFGRFIRALVDRFPCVDAIEVGNEINAVSAKFPDGPDKAPNYVAVLRATREALTGTSRPVALIGGSSLSVATGFMERLFAAGMLPLVDAVAIHPYADVPEALPAQLRRLRDAMTRAGTVKPIWATEIGLEYPTPEAAPPHGWKQMALLSAEGIAHADWYALLDERWYPNMGLYKGAEPRPALQMFQRAARSLATEGHAQRIETGDALTYAYRFGNGHSLLWASGRSIRFAPGTALVDAQGRNLATLQRLGPDPVIAAPGARWELGPVEVLADTQYQAGQAPWRAAITNPDGMDRELRWIDTNWASHLGAQDFPNVLLSPGLVVLPQSVRPLALVESFRSPVSGSLWVSACLIATKAAMPAITIMQNGRTIGQIGNGAAGVQPAIELKAAAGDVIAISYARQGTGRAPVSVRRRIRILTTPQQEQVLCPVTPSGRE
jgi:hypothetical protein